MAPIARRGGRRGSVGTRERWLPLLDPEGSARLILRGGEPDHSRGRGDVDEER